MKKVRIMPLFGGDAAIHIRTIERLIGQLIGDEQTVNREWIERTFADAEEIVMFGAFLGSDLIGFAMGRPIQHLTAYELKVDDVVVDQAYRGKGIGKELTMALIDQAKRKRCTGIILLSSRPGAQAMFQKLGFEEKTAFLLKL